MRFNSHQCGHLAHGKRRTLLNYWAAMLASRQERSVDTYCSDFHQLLVVETVPIAAMVAVGVVADTSVPRHHHSYFYYDPLDLRFLHYSLRLQVSPWLVL